MRLVGGGCHVRRSLQEMGIITMPKPIPDIFHYAITIHTDDLAVVHCFRSLAQYSEHYKYKKCAWKGTGANAWTDSQHQVTFRFTQPEYREEFRQQCKRLL